MRKVAFVQHGDFLEASRRFLNGGEETYYAQRYSVEHVERLVPQFDGVMVVCIASGQYKEVLPSGVVCAGIPDVSCNRKARHELLSLLQDWGATDVIVRWPSSELISDLLHRRVRVLPLFADSFPKKGLKSRFRHWRISRILSNPRITLVANHQVPASRDLIRIGVNPDKVVPWDWPSTLTPRDFPVKNGIARSHKVHVVYAGLVIETKGVGDVIRAVARLNDTGWDITFSIAGSGTLGVFEKLAKSLAIAHRVHFLGRIPHHEVVCLMHQHDVVIVPSWHEYDEGLPMTIQDAFISHTPLVASNHPMFTPRLEDGRSALLFPARDDAALARCIARLATDTTLYASLSRESVPAWESLRLPVLWGELLTRWLSSDSGDHEWLSKHSLTYWPYP